MAKILRDGRRKRTRAFTELQSHHLFEDRFGRPGKGNDKRKVEGMVGRAAQLPGAGAVLRELPCAERPPGADGRPAQGPPGDHRPAHGAGPGGPAAPAGRTLRCLREAGGPGEFPVPGPVPDQGQGTRPVAYGHRDVLVRGYVDQVVISCGSEVIARHPRSYQRDDFVYDPIHQAVAGSQAGRAGPHAV